MRLMTAPSLARRNSRGDGLPALRPRRQRADLDEAEAEPQQRARRFGVLVEAGGKPERIGEIQAEGANGEPRG